MNQKEKELIESHLGKDYCLNIARGGYGGDLFRGHNHTVESKAKISAANKGHEVTNETRAKISAAHKGKKLSEEQKKKCPSQKRKV